MNRPFDSVYPDLLRTGLNKLGLLDARRELLALFSALEHFRWDLHAQDSTAGILEISHRYVAGLNLFRTTGFWLVNPTDLAFELMLGVPSDENPALRRIVDREIASGRFAWALRQNAPVFFQVEAPGHPERGVLHGLTLSSQVVGMFCGLLQREIAPNQEITFSLLSLLLGASADALATLRKTRQLANEIETLSGLLPLCAWCKKVRTDSGYWEQIEGYISANSSALVTHGVCPDCRKKFLDDLEARSPEPA
jgi:hypothetical protein